MKTAPVTYFNGWFGGGTAELPLHPRAVTPKIIKVFTCGQCHAFALSVHEATGWELVGLWSCGEEYGEDTPSHVVVRRPDGDLFDIEGPDAESRWRGYEEHSLTKDEVEDFQNHDYLQPNKEVAKPYARLVLRKYGIKKFTPRRKRNAQP